MNTAAVRPSVPALAATAPGPSLAAIAWRVTLVGPRLLEDKPLARRFGSEYRVRAFARLREALASMDDESQRADVVVAEQTLIDGTGVELLRDLRVRSPDTLRVLVLDSTDSEVVQQAVNDAAVYQVIIAPWQEESLRLLLRRALESRELARIHR